MTRVITILLVFFFSLHSNAQVEVKFFTTEGDFKVLLYTDKAPITAGNFLKLVDEGYYDSTIFHRVIDNFMIQGGDPTGTGSGGPGYTIPDEFDSSLSNVQKTISMANSGPNTGGSQFFINLVNNTYLDHDKKPYTSKHPVFGIVTDSFEVVQRIGKVRTYSSNNRPIQEVRIDSIRRVQYRTLPAYVEVEDMTISPNPIGEFTNVFISYSNEEGESLSIPSIVNFSVVDISGHVIWTKEVELNEQTFSEGSTHYIYMDELYDLGLQSGLYYLTVRDKNDFYRRTKFVVVN